MKDNLSIIIVADSEDRHWHETAHKIKDALDAASASLADSPDVRFLDVEELHSLAQLKDRLLCIICHPANHIIRALSHLNLDPLWLFVSGGDRPSVQFLSLELTASRTLWFSGVYGRETQFRAWLINWAEHGFSADVFAKTHEALFSGKTGVGITAERLRRNLLPLIIVFESYQGLVGSLPAADSNSILAMSVDRAHNWLIDSLSQLWKHEELFKSLSKDAALIHGAIKNWSPNSRISQSRLVELLKDFLPRSGGHAEFDPALDESLRGLILNRIDPSKIDGVVNEWCQKLAELSGLLDNFPSQDPSSVS
jgi:hypothetical protein